jgi:anti-anti-sigma factor
MAFTSTLDWKAQTALITLTGELDAAAAPVFRADIEKAADQHAQRLVLRMEGLTYMASAGLRTLIFAKQKIGQGVDLYIVGTQETVLETIRLTGFDRSVIVQDTYTD